MLMIFAAGATASLSAQTAQQPANQTGTSAVAPSAEAKPPAKPNDAITPTPGRAEMLRGAYGPDRANNDLLYYHLDIRVDPEKQIISGKNTIRFKMIENGTRIQLDLRDTLAIDKILWGTTPLKYERDTGAVFVDFPRTLRAGEVASIDFYYSGHPDEYGRFGDITFK